MVEQLEEPERYEVYTVRGKEAPCKKQQSLPS